MDVSAILAMAGKVMLGAAAAVSLWFMARGIMDMQRVNAADPEVLELLGVVRQLTSRSRDDLLAVVTINAGDDVRQVDCVLPGGWFGRRKWQVTDFVRVLWRRGDARAVAVQTIRDGQTMFIVGIVALVMSGVLAVLMF